MTSAQLPEKGQVVRVRSRHYLVEDVEVGRDDTQSLVRLACLDDDAQGFALSVLWEKEVDRRVLTDEAWAAVAKKGFDRRDHFAAYLDTLRWNTVTSTDPELFQSPYRAGLLIKDYQLEPLRKALKLPRVNLFIADDVGLGKTIEAGLIIRELLIRQKVRRIVVGAPASVLQQWRGEMENRFGLPFVVLDREYVLRIRRERGWATNPWTTHSRFVISHSLLGDAAYTGPLLDWLGTFCPGSLLVLDEAHHAAPASSSKYAIDSQFTRGVRDLAHRFEHRLFLSATPHNGHSNSFSALLEILDPLRFCRGVAVKGPGLLDQVMVRRLKSDFRGVTEAFPKRVVEQIDIDGLPSSAPELKLSELLAEYQSIRAELARDLKKSRQAAAALVTTHLQQRLLSSVEAFARSLSAHRRTLASRPPVEEDVAVGVGRLTDLLAPASADDEKGLLDEAQEAAGLDAALSEANVLAASSESAPAALRDRQARVLDAMTELAEQSRYEPDARIKRLVDWVETNLRPGGKWNRRRVLIFTEWTDTLRYLEQQLGGYFEEERIAKFHGALGEDSREELKQRFNADPDAEPLRILLATDAAREGLNLQNHCADLFHFDVPWNPARLEQRNGRIDRVLQKEKEVFCRYFFYRQRPEDRVLKALVTKTETIEKQLGSLSPVLEQRLQKLLAAGIDRAKVDALSADIESAAADAGRAAEVEQELEVARQREEQLRDQTDTLRTLLEKSQNAIRFNEKAFREALSCALDVLGAEPLSPVPDKKGRVTFAFPALDQRKGADPSWSAAMDLLRPPCPKGVKPNEWRQKFPPRPVVFKDTGSLDTDVVHLHLEHRVVQRLLARFRAQGFIHDDLSRACVLETRETRPQAVLLGRVSIYGDHASRLHEELVAVAATLEKGETRLKPVPADDEKETLRTLNTALGDAAQKPVPKVVQERLRSLAHDHVAGLRKNLEARGAAAIAAATKDLAKRGVKEAKDMEVLIREQRKRIEREIATNDKKRQLDLEYDEHEKYQLEADRKHWEKRLAELDTEAEREPSRIRAIYEVRATRIEPVGLVYLWPRSA